MSLARVERAFRQIKTGRLRVRPIFAYSEARVRIHVFSCMLACLAKWHMKRRLAPILFDEDDPEDAQAQRASASIRLRCSQSLAGGIRRIAFLPREICVFAPLSSTEWRSGTTG